MKRHKVVLDIIFPKEDIWIQWTDDDGDPLGEEVTWCNEKINKTDIHYRRVNADHYDICRKTLTKEKKEEK
jgi:hypothetical protein